MRYLLLPFFIVRLLIAIIPFFIQFFWTLLFPFRSFIITILFSIYFCLVLVMYLRAFYRQQKYDQSLEKLSQAQLQQEISKWQKFYEIQPTHRDVLINLSLLYSAQKDQEKAAKYLHQAQMVDPNHPYFK